VKVFVVDTTKCNGCHDCQIACKDEHVSNDWMPYARPQPDTGQFWLKLNQRTRGNVPQVKVAYWAVMCQHCDDAPCMKACPVKDGIYRRPDGLVIIDPAKCTGCQSCVDACTYGAIFYNEGLNLAQKCTGCAHLLDKGWKTPRCADACPNDALQFGEEADFKDQIAKGEILEPNTGPKLKARAYYLGLPKRFIAGTVYDPGAKDVVTDATVTLTGEGQTLTQTTNHWGDFWFEGLKVGTYSLKIDKASKTKTIANISTQKDVGLGDISLA
jgi:Fe-S-cluster-containing dehydrogenase component